MISNLTIYDPGLGKVRIGRSWDGGYILPLQSICQSEALFSYGVNDDWSFETHYVNATNKSALLFDHTIKPITFCGEIENKMTHFKEGLSATKTQCTDNFLSHYEKYFDSTFKKKVLLKLDVESAEYDFFLNTDIEKLAEITTGFVVEFHHIDDETNQSMFFECLNRINKYFYLCHLHGNNYLDSFNYVEERFYKTSQIKYYETFIIPKVLELSFVNKSLVANKIRDYNSYPCPILDKPNTVLRPECDLSFLKKIVS